MNFGEYAFSVAEPGAGPLQVGNAAWLHLLINKQNAPTNEIKSKHYVYCLSGTCFYGLKYFICIAC